MTFDKPDILAVMEREGVTLTRRGREYKGLCPLHQEKTPSFDVNPDKQVWCCRGCGKGGDVVSFIMDYRGLDFKEAVSYLGGQLQDRDNPQVALRQAKQRLVAEFNAWREGRRSELASQIKAAERIVRQIKTVSQAESAAPLYHRLSEFEYEYELLYDDGSALEIYKGVRGGESR